MLRITQQSSADAARTYYASADADYYKEGREAAGVWGGKGARQLGLEGMVQKEAFDRLCENLNPAGDGPLTARKIGDRTVGYDFTWSVPKSVSLRYAMTQDERLLDAFRESVRETMKEIEAEAKTRIRKNGQNAERVTGNLVWAEFTHFTSRPVNGVPDPQLHAHCFAFNATWDQSEKQWKASQFKDLKRDAPYWQAAFRARLANRLQALGFSLERKRDDFELAGVSAATTNKFARRTALIEDEAAKRGIKDPNRKAALGALTREGKNEQHSWDELRQIWQDRLSPDELTALTTQPDEAATLSATPSAEKVAVTYAIEHCFERQSVVPEKTLVAEAIKRGLGQVTVEDVWKELSRRPLLRGEVDGRRMVTSPDIVAEEQGIIDFARKGRGTCKPLVGFDRKLSREWLNAEQQKAVRHLWESPDKVMLLRGAAGSGKTSLLQEMIEGIRAAGHRVVALAPSAEASRGVLREAGMKDADTVARFLLDDQFRENARNGVLLIDESSLLGSRTLARVFHLAQELSARCILVGDSRQHSSVERGSAFRLLQERSGVQIAEVSTILRQQNAGYKDAVQALSDGHILDGFDKLDSMLWVQEIPDGERELRLADDYLKAVAAPKKGKEQPTALVIAPTHLEAARVTSAIRLGLKEAGKLKNERTFVTWTAAGLTEAERGDSANLSPGDMLQLHQHIPGHKSGERMLVREGEALPLAYASRYQVYRPTEVRFAVGDRLRVTANGKSKDGNRLDNGSLWTVQGFTPAGDIIVDKGKVIGREFGHIAMGYVITSWASQGKSISHVFLAQSSLSFPASSREQFLVSASRGKHSLTVYTDDKAALRDAIKRSDPRLSAIDLVQPKRPGIAPQFKKYLASIRRAANYAMSQVAEIPSSVRELSQELVYGR